jgi:hypothetical protein
MDYRDLAWGELKSFAKSQGINTKGLKKVEILEQLDNMTPGGKRWHTEKILGQTMAEHSKDLSSYANEDFTEFKGIKETHPIFEEIKPFLPALKVYNTINGMGIKCEVTSTEEGISKGIALLYMKHIETHKGAVVALGGCCIHKYYPRLTFGYNELAKKYGRECI